MNANKYQKLLLEAYPSVDLLGIDLDDPASIDIAVEADETGDSLFNFLWRELKDVTDDDEALQRIDTAIVDLNAVRDAIEKS